MGQAGASRQRESGLYRGPMTDDLTVMRKKLLFRAEHRGFKEADIVIGGFVRSRLEVLDREGLDALELLLSAPDQELYAWIMEREAVPAERDASLIADIRRFVAAGGAKQL